MDEEFNILPIDFDDHSLLEEVHFKGGLVRL